MTTLDQLSTQAPPHVLLIGQTKAGKTHYCAKAAQAGWKLLYLDSDHGYATLQHVLRDDAEARKRVHYLRMENPMKFLLEFVGTSTFVAYSAKEQGLLPNISSHPEDDKVTLIRPGKIPPNVILVIDSWTGVAGEILASVGSELGVDVNTASANAMRAVYGNAGRIATTILKSLQFAPFPTIVQAHPVWYEIKKKPKGKGKYKEEDMELVQTIQVPISTSQPHGHTIGKFFTDIGNLSVNRLGETVVSYKRDDAMVSGGTQSIAGKGEAVAFATLFGKPPANLKPDSGPEGWVEELTFAEFKARRKEGTLMPKPPEKTLKVGRIT